MKRLLLNISLLLNITNISSAKTPEINRLDYAHAALQGKRPTMEDAFNVLQDNVYFQLFGLYDGHGGAGVANELAANLNIAIGERIRPTNIEYYLKDRYIDFNNNLDKYLYRHQGSTAVTAVIMPTKIVVANTGDSRAVLCSKGKAIALSEDHKPNRPDELERIINAGGFIITRGVPRVNGVLALSRAMGDFALAPSVIPDPEIVTHNRSNTDQFLILACDGVWDVLSNQEAVDIVKSVHEKTGTLEHAAHDLTKHALAAGSTDNISVIIIKL